MDTEIIAWIYYASEWLIRLAMLPVVLRRRRPSTAMSWLLIIFLFPWIGLILYSMIGYQRLGRFRAKRAEEARALVRKRGVALARERSHILAPPVRPAQDDFVAVARRLGESPMMGGNEVEALIDTDQVIDAIIADIDKAQHFVHVLMYIFRNDETGSRVADALERAARRGVQVRLALDGSGSRRFLKRRSASLRRAGAQITILLPVNLARLALSRLDIRNHRKIILIDGMCAWTGSQNIVNADYGQRSIGAWRDIMLRVSGPAVIPLHRIFISDWYADSGELLDDESLLPDPGEPGSIVTQIISSGPYAPNRALQDLYLAAIGEAEERIIITSPYFVPDEPVIAALRVSVMRGVRVDLIIPERGNNFFAHAAGRSYAGELIATGAYVHLHQDGLLHAKTMTIDDSIAMVGSSNFDVRSFDINYELNLIFYGPEPTNLLRAQQERYIEESRDYTSDEHQAIGAWRRFSQDASRLLSPLL